MKRISSDSTRSVVRLNTTAAIKHDDKYYQPRPFIACTYDNQWHIGSVVERSYANNDVLINFMEMKDEMHPYHSHVRLTNVEYLFCMCSVQLMCRWLKDRACDSTNSLKQTIFVSLLSI